MTGKFDPMPAPQGKAGSESHRHYHADGSPCDHDHGHHGHGHHGHVHPTVVPVRSTPKIGRNEPCTCGSGRKYKRCCAA